MSLFSTIIQRLSFPAGTSVVAAPDPVKRMMSAASGQGSFDSAIGEEGKFFI